MMKHLLAILYAIAAVAVTPAGAATVIYIDSYRFGEPASPPPGGDPTFVSVSAPTVSAAVDLPASVAEGDLLIAFCVAAGGASTLSTPSGWTQVGSKYTWTIYSYQTAAYYKIAAASEPSTTNFGSNIREGYMACYRNASSVSDYGSYTQASGASNLLTGVASGSGKMLLALIHDRDTAPAFTPPTDMTERLDSGATYWRHGLADQLAAPTEDKTWTMTAGSFPSVAVLLVIE